MIRDLAFSLGAMPRVYASLHQRQRKRRESKPAPVTLNNSKVEGACRLHNTRLGLRLGRDARRRKLLPHNLHRRLGPQAGALRRKFTLGLGRSRSGLCGGVWGCGFGGGEFGGGPPGAVEDAVEGLCALRLRREASRARVLLVCQHAVPQQLRALWFLLYHSLHKRRVPLRILDIRVSAIAQQQLEHLQARLADGRVVEGCVLAVVRVVDDCRIELEKHLGDVEVPLLHRAHHWRQPILIPTANLSPRLPHKVRGDLCVPLPTRIVQRAVPLCILALKIALRLTRPVEQDFYHGQPVG
mmetsp:Transcript_43425/g.106236  ORF Transcript_43425/g.106236 Transcript_43425/m.106236 type:complete len:298 (-) Transcript_43425:382-1275(-)